jgi:RNA polymerase sigma-70 factor, ECF subfamily
MIPMKGPDAAGSTGATKEAARPHDSGPSDLDLVRLAQQGDRAAFDRLVRKYRPKLITLAARYTHNVSDAEDATQDALVKTYRGLADFRGECAFYTWLYRITVNSAKNLLQTRAREHAITTSSVLREESLEAPWQSQDLATPERLTLTEDIRATVNAALQRLPEVHREAIILRELEGMSYEQIAQVMGTPIGTVRSRVFRARELIDHELRRVFDGGLGREAKRRSRSDRAA